MGVKLYGLAMGEFYLKLLITYYIQNQIRTDRRSRE